MNNLDELSMQVNGCLFDESPIEWQRTIDNMVKRGITFNLTGE